MKFREVAVLLLPADGGGVILEAPDSWGTEELEGRDTTMVVWGRGPRAVGDPIGDVLRTAAARERALRRLRRSPPRPFSHTRIHRWPLPQVRPGALRNRVKRALFEGAFVELSREPVIRVIDACAHVAGDPDPALSLRPGSAEAVVAYGTPAGGEPYVLRATRADAPADPYPTGDVLERLREAGCGPVPRLMGRGRTAGASWTTESRLSGRRPQRLSPAMASAVAEFCAALPPADGPPTVHRQDFAALARRFPARGAEIEEIGAVVDRAVRDLPGVFRHGDLWVGNLLTQGGRLSGVVDWDAGHTHGIPGSDLLHLYAVERAMARGREIGETWLMRPWRSEAYARLCQPQWRALGVRPEPEQLEAIGLAWWAGRVPEMILTMETELLAPGWVERNVDAVVDAALA